LKRRLVFLIGTIIAAFFAFLPVSAISLQVKPSRFILQVKPGQKDGGAIIVSNPTRDVLKCVAIVKDWDLDAAGNLSTSVAGTLDTSLGSWLKFNPRQFTIQPNGHQVVRFSVAVPKNATPGERRGIIFFSPSYGNTGMAVKTEVGVTVYVAVQPVTRTFDLTLEKTALNKQKQAEVKYAVTATGNAHCRLSGKYKLYDQDGKIVEERNLNEQVVLPGKKMNFAINGTRELEPGHYRLHLEIACQGVSTVFRRDFEIDLQ
jgi:hypothetical protein